MKQPVVCGVIADNDEVVIQKAEPLVDMFEVRIDRIGDGWQEVARQLSKPWIACNRIVAEGGRWQGSEARRKEELLRAAELGAAIIDIELVSANLERIVPMIKKRAKCLISFHHMECTPPLDELKKIVRRQQAAGADMCKVVTTAQNFNDNLILLELISAFPQVEITAFAMGEMGLTSRVLGPLLGGGPAYAALKEGGQSAAGQPTAAGLHQLYEMIKQ